MKLHSWHTAVDWLETEFQAAKTRAREQGQSLWAGDGIDIEPLDIFGRFSAADDYAWLFAPPTGPVTLGLGIARQWVWRQPRAWAWMASIWQRLKASALPQELCVTGGHAFATVKERTPCTLWSDFANTGFVLPAVQLTRSHDRTRLVFAAEITPDSDVKALLAYYRRILTQVFEPTSIGSSSSERVLAIASVPDRWQWKELVQEAKDTIRAGFLDKVVLSRRISLTFEEPLNIEGLLRHLHVANPEATLFAIRHGTATFVGATPEQLLQVQDNHLKTMCLAGSASRGITPEEDARLAEELLHHRKNQAEHQAVRTHVVNVLTPLCESLDIPARPGLRRLPTVQHLYTPVEAILRPNTSIWSVVSKLHPTPAVAGAPVDEASQWILAHEPFDRGWFAGTVGQVDLRGNGQFVVALRSGLVQGRRAHLYAGCGIMEDSDPEQEFEESGWKFRTMLQALGADGVEA